MEIGLQTGAGASKGHSFPRGWKDGLSDPRARSPEEEEEEELLSG